MKERENYIDNLRVYLTVLVVLHHAAVTYGASGSWYYKEASDAQVPKILMTAFVAVNQSFFMGMFFLLSAYFIPASYDKKGATKFLSDRFKRLGIPIVFYSLVIHPVTVYTILKLNDHTDLSFFNYYINQESWINLGVLWFTAALLLFSIVFVLITKLDVMKLRLPETMPSDKSIFVFGLALGIISFVVRISFPIGWTLSPLGFQFAHFTQYIALFIIGIAAYRNKWFVQLTYQRGQKWRRIASLIAPFGFVLLYMLSVGTGGDTSKFLGGGTYQSFVNAVWEQLMGVAIIVCLLGIGKHRWNMQSDVMKQLSRCAYAVYIIHPFFLVVVSLLLKDVEIFTLAKFIISGTVAVAASFGVAWALVRTPLVNDVV
jgi:glucan biosynthesis protein C